MTERYMVTIETERTGKITLTPAQFDMLLDAASVGLDRMPVDMPEAEALWDIVEEARIKHSV
jgi:hypothetical protein